MSSSMIWCAGVEPERVELLARALELAAPRQAEGRTRKRWQEDDERAWAEAFVRLEPVVDELARLPDAGGPSVAKAVGEIAHQYREYLVLARRRLDGPRPPTPGGGYFGLVLWASTYIEYALLRMLHDTCTPEPHLQIDVNAPSWFEVWQRAFTGCGDLIHGPRSRRVLRTTRGPRTWIPPEDLMTLVARDPSAHCMTYAEFRDAVAADRSCAPADADPPIWLPPAESEDSSLAMGGEFLRRQDEYREILARLWEFMLDQATRSRAYVGWVAFLSDD